MKRKSKSLHEYEDISFKELNVSLPPFLQDECYSITVFGAPVGHPLTKEQAVLITDWFKSVIIEYDNYNENDVF